MVIGQWPARRRTGSESRAGAIRRRRTPQEARAEIIEAARGFLATRGFADLTVGALMARTRIGRSAFYAYFKDVYELSEIFVHEVAERIDSSATIWWEHDGDPRSQVRAGLQRAIEFWQVNGRMIRALEQAATRDRRLRKIWLTDFALRPVARVAGGIRRQQAAGLIGPMDADEVSRALNRFNLSYLNDCFGTDRQRDTVKVLDTLERVWFGTLYGKPPEPRPQRTKRRRSGVPAGRPLKLKGE